MTGVLVVGAAGLLGREVVRAAAETGAEVARAGRNPRPGWISFDAERDPADALLEAPVEVIVNCAGVLATELDRRPEAYSRAAAVNARFPRDLADAAAERGVRLVHVSTDAVFPADAGRCFEDSTAHAADAYGETKLRGEPDSPNALTIRCSFVGRDPSRRRGLLEWLLAQPAGSEVPGYVDHAWNGLTSVQVGRICAALADPALFDRARRESSVHHLFEDPPLSKHDLLTLMARTFRHDVRVVPARSAAPSTRILGSRHAVLRECLRSGPTREESLLELARRDERRDG